MRRATGTARAAPALAGLLLAAAAAPAAAQWRAFVQTGAAPSTRALSFGFARELGAPRETGWGVLQAQAEVALGRWVSDVDDGPRASAWVTQLGLTPALRLSPSAWPQGWFVQGGLGAHWLAPLYRSEGKHFSTVFNFGTHLAIGRRFGVRDEQELSLRVEHFSNAGIRRPNPGENLLQLRWARRF